MVLAARLQKSPEFLASRDDCLVCPWTHPPQDNRSPQGKLKVCGANKTMIRSSVDNLTTRNFSPRHTNPTGTPGKHRSQQTRARAPPWLWGHEARTRHHLLYIARRDDRVADPCVQRLPFLSTVQGASPPTLPPIPYPLHRNALRSSPISPPLSQYHTRTYSTSWVIATADGRDSQSHQGDNNWARQSCPQRTDARPQGLSDTRLDHGLSPT